jgi:hypothetical protein
VIGGSGLDGFQSPCDLLQRLPAFSLLNDGGLKLKNADGFKEHPLFLIALLLACTIFFASCGDNTTSNSSPIPPASNTQASAITPIGAQVTCLTVNAPSLVKLADGNYQVADEIGNCGENNAGPLTLGIQVHTQATKQSMNFLGPATIAAHGKALYRTFAGQAGGANKEIQFPSPSPSSAIVTVVVTINGTVQGEWDGQVTIPAP